MRPIIIFVASWLAAVAVLILRATCRIRIHHDPRSTFRRQKQGYVFSVLHAHQVSAVMDGERGTGAMVSRSGDGQIIVPTLRVLGIIPIRGSGRTSASGKGGREALECLIQHVRNGSPAYLAIDGPRGPRGHVHKGIAVLAQRSGAAVLNMVAVPSRRWVFASAWDRLQIPKPFAMIDAYFSTPLHPRLGESTEEFRQRIERDLRELEARHDPLEAAAPIHPRNRSQAA